MPNKTALIPLRETTEWLGGSIVNFNVVSNRISLKTATGVGVVLTLNSTKAVIGKQEIMLDDKVIEKDGNTFVPSRFFEKAFNAKIEWIEKTQQVIITHPTKKKTMTFIIAGTPTTSAPTAKPEKASDDIILGAGFGIPYGGIGGNAEYHFNDKSAAFVGVGIQTFGLGWSVGGRYYLKSDYLKIGQYRLSAGVGSDDHYWYNDSTSDATPFIGFGWGPGKSTDYQGFDVDLLGSATGVTLSCGYHF